MLRSERNIAMSCCEVLPENERLKVKTLFGPNLSQKDVLMLFLWQFRLGGVWKLVHSLKACTFWIFKCIPISICAWMDHQLKFVLVEVHFAESPMPQSWGLEKVEKSAGRERKRFWREAKRLVGFLLVAMFDAPFVSLASTAYRTEGTLSHKLCQCQTYICICITI